MSRNGSGVYSLPPGINPVAQDTVITSNWANTTLSDIAAALTQSLARDGQTTPIANLPMGGFRHTNVGNPTARNQYASLGWVQDGFHVRLTSVGGSNAISAQLTGNTSALQTGQLVQLTPVASNTGNVTLSINSIGPKPVVLPDGRQIGSGDFKPGYPYLLVYDGSKFIVANAPSSAGSVYSVAVESNATGLEVTGSPITDSGTIVLSYLSGYRGFTDAQNTKLNGIAAGATAGANWNSNLSNIPANITSWAGIAPSSKTNTSEFYSVGFVEGGTYDGHFDSSHRGVSYLFHAASGQPSDAPFSPARQGSVLNLGNNWGRVQLAVSSDSSSPQLFIRGGSGTDWTTVWTSSDFDPANQPASNITSGTFANARISQSSVTQHQGALSIGYGQLTNTPSIPTSSDYVATSGNQSGLSGNKTWTGAHTWTQPINVQAASNSERVIAITDGAGLRMSLNLHSSGQARLCADAVAIHLRPNGENDSSGQTIIATNGDMSVNGTISDTNGNVRKLSARTANSNTTLAAGDLNGVVENTNNSSYTYTIPSGLGTHSDAITIVNSGTGGNITLARGSGVTLYRGGTNANITVGPGSMVTIYRSNTANRWIA